MSKDLYFGYAEQVHEDYMQDMLYLQASQYDEERSILERLGKRPEKRLFNYKNRFKNRIYLRRFARYGEKDI